MRVRVGSAVYRGRAVDLRNADVGPTAVYEAICAGTSNGRVVVNCPPPAVGHEVLWNVGDSENESLFRSLEAAARSRGMSAPEDDERASVEARLSELDAPDVDTTEARRRVASAGADEERLRERVAALRGKVQGRREAGRDASEVRRTLTEEAARLAEVETERIAAEQALARAERDAAAARDVREKRLRLQDRAANFARDARRRLANDLYDEFASAVRSMPGDADPGASPSEFRGDPVTARLAAVRVAALDAPVVLRVDPFDDAESAARRLDTPVVRI